jgi:endonuclease-3
MGFDLICDFPIKSYCTSNLFFIPIKRESRAEVVMLVGERIVHDLEKEYPPLKTALNYNNPFELLIATILSAQTTDSVVNKTTPLLFKKYPTSKDMSRARVGVLEKIVRPTGFYHLKARRIKEVADTIEKKFGGRVPCTMDELTSLKGVGRKTANIVMSVAFDKIEGIAVDTHVKRLSNRIGLTKSQKLNEIEQDLMKVTPRPLWSKLSILLILHGRNICLARRPLCERCVISRYCAYYKSSRKARVKQMNGPLLSSA